MTKSIGSLLFFLFPLLLSFNLDIESLCCQSGGHLKFANGLVAHNSWCVASPSASEAELNSNIEYACNMLGDCRMIQSGGSCFYPDTPMNHASAVMNLYYALNGKNTWNCHFSGSGLIVVTDPSYDSCKYA